MLIHHQLRWLGHVIRMPDSRLPHHVHYGQLRQGHRSVGGLKKRFNDQINTILKNGNIPFNRLKALMSNRVTRAFGMSYFDAECDRTAAATHSRRHRHAAAPRTITDFARHCPLYGRQFGSRIALHSYSKSHIQR